MQSTRVVSILAAALALAVSAAAQGPGVRAFPPLVAAGVQIFDVQPFEGAAVARDAPFSAEAVTEVTQTLADGNRIERTLTSSIARDSRGRVRREEQIALLGPLAVQGDVPAVVTITDPERGHFTLDDRRKVAMHMPMPRLERAPQGGGDVTFFFSQGAAIGTAIGAARAGGATFQAAITPPDVTTEKLGQREIDGMLAEGTRTTFTIPARTLGNLNPIDIVTERWYSPDLQMAVLITRHDPRAGDTTYRLVNVVRAEPPADLFEVPADYTVQQAPAFKAIQTLPPR
jgi:hypothetical protein